jgi:hypothetical protein
MTWTGRLVLIAVVVALAVAGGALWVNLTRAPAEVDVSGARAEVLLAAQDVETFTKGFPGVWPRPRGSEQLIAGTITVPPSLRDHDNYAVFVINERTKAVARDMWGSSEGRPLSRGWDGRYNEAAETYRWLAPAASTQTGTGWQDAGTNISFGPEALASPIEFVAFVDNFGLPVKAKDITVGLAAWDGEGDLAWAAVLPQEPAAPTTG